LKKFVRTDLLFTLILAGSLGFLTHCGGGPGSDIEALGGNPATRPIPGFGNLEVSGETSANAYVVAEDAEGTIYVSESEESGVFSIPLPTGTYYSLKLEPTENTSYLLTFPADDSDESFTGIFYAADDIPFIDLGVVSIDDDNGIARPASNPLEQSDKIKDGVPDLKDDEAKNERKEIISKFEDVAIAVIAYDEKKINGETPATEEPIPEQPPVEQQPSSEGTYQEEKDQVGELITHLKDLRDETEEIKQEIKGAQLEIRALRQKWKKASPDDKTRIEELTAEVKVLQADLKEVKNQFQEEFSQAKKDIKGFMKRWKSELDS